MNSSSTGPAACFGTVSQKATEQWRDVKKRKTRRALVAAARDQIAREGLDAVTVDAICQAAGVSRRTFFNYFTTKEAAVLDLPEDAIDPRTAEEFSDGGPTGDLSDDIRVLARSLLKNTSTRFDDLRTLASVVNSEPRLVAIKLRWFEKHLALVKELVARRLGGDADRMRCDLVAFSVTALARGAVLAWEADGLAGDPDDYVDRAATHLRSAFGALP